MLCAKYETGRVCVGDSGGALVADRDNNGVWVLYGVVSFGSTEVSIIHISNTLGQVHINKPFQFHSQCENDGRQQFDGYAHVPEYAETIMSVVEAA